MHLKDRNGMTATVDVMIFIVILGFAATALYSVPDGDTAPYDESSELVNELFSSELRLSDIMDSDDTSVYTLPDMLAASMAAGDPSVGEYIKTVLDSSTGRPGSYRLDLDYGDIRTVVGDGDGTPVSVYSEDFAVTLGGTLRAELAVY